MVCSAVIIVMGFTVYFQVSGQHHKSPSDQDLRSDSGRDRDRSGTKDSVTVSFGGWMANPHQCPGVPPNPPAPCPIVDRFPANAATQFPRFSNHHVIIPEIAKIKAGGYVNFIISGFHVVTVYDDGTKPDDIDTTILVPGPRPGPPIINDAENRIYRGLDPLQRPPTSAQDRVEVVQFDEPGTYLVICSVLPHFQEGMFAFVRVLPGGRGDDDDDDVK